MWKTRDRGGRFVLLYTAGHLLLICAGLLFFRQFGNTGIESLNIFKFAIGVPMIPLAFFVYRKRVWQSVFALAMSFIYNLIPQGVGSYAFEHWASPASYPLLTPTAVTIAVTAVTLPPLLYILRRLYDNPSTKQTVVFWRLIWMMPMMFFIVFLMGNNYLFANEINAAYFFTFRVIIYCALVFISFLFDAVFRQVWEAEAARRKAGEAEAKADFYRRMSHEIRTPLTVVSTNIQTARRRPEEADELLEKSQATIMEMAKIINDALEEGNENEVVE